VEPNSRLIHVGSSEGAERYHALLLALVTELEVRNVEILGGVSQARLMAFYEVADLFLCMSEHEGFCIPLLESMVHDVPVLAYAAAAVPETMDGAGILFHDKQFDVVAEMMGRTVKDAAFREAVLQGQRARVARYREQDLEKKLRGFLEAWL
jgi:glycosyltransferase involved in cell wall biosynthesis